MQKKGGMWHFCVIYIALNQVIVLNQYPILIVDELLDELHGVIVFFKLDLHLVYDQIWMQGEDIVKKVFLRIHCNVIWTAKCLVHISKFNERVFRPHLWKCMLISFYGILIFYK